MEEEAPEDGVAVPEPRFGPADLAAAVAAKLCHDMISPAGAINSGVDFLKDPNSADMHEYAVGMIADSAKKLGAMVEFYRIALGASASASTFDPRELKSLTERVFEHMRAELDWDVALESVPKPVARALLNIAQLAGGGLPRGGSTRVTARLGDEGYLLVAESTGRIIVKDEVLRGLARKPLGEGMMGSWVQGYYIATVVAEAGGTVRADKGEERFAIAVRLPA